MNPSLYLIDVSALAYRSFFAFIKSPLKRKSDGKETSALFGFAQHILRLIAERNPDYIAFVKDLKGPTKRHEKYEDYKAHREPMPDSLAAQLPDIDGFVEKSGLRTVALPGYEADDVMATLALQARRRGWTSYLVTRDKDLMQLVDDKIFLFDLGKASDGGSLVVGAKEVKEKWGVGPEHIVDFLALAGDSSDNVPGVSKVGPKTAADLLNTYGSLERVYQNVDNITKKALRENLIKDKELAFLSQELVTLHTDLDLPLGLEDLKYPGIRAAELRPYLEQFDLHSLIKLIPGVDANALEPEAPAAAKEHPGRYALVNSEENLRAMMADLHKTRVLAVDTETTGLDSKTAGLVGICLSTGKHTGYYVAVGHRQGPNLDLEIVGAALKPVFDDPDRILVFHNAKYDLPILARHGLMPAGIDRPGKLADTMIAAHLCNPGDRQVSLDDLALKHFGHTMIPIEALIGKGKAQKNFAETPQDEACRYGAEDADYTWQLWRHYEKELAEKDLARVFTDLEMPLLPVLLAMEQKGVAIDTDALHGLSQDLHTEITRLEKEIHQLAGHDFNVNSTQQLQQVLFDELHLKTGKKTKTGFSTDSAVLQRLEGEHDIVGRILEYREMTKLQSTYVETLPTLVHSVTHRVHTTYSQVIAATGRLSSVNPNLQNIPIRTELGRKIRSCFVAPKGRRLLAADYSQIELRLLAHLSGDPALKEAYRQGLDIHARTAAALFQVPEEQVTSDMRRAAKVVNFGVLYGMGSQRLSQQLKIPRDQAKNFIENYFATFARVDLFIRETVDQARRRGYVETLSGRRRYLPDLHSDSPMLKEQAERIAVNTPVQGSAADLIKIAMIHIHRRLQKEKLPCDMLLQVHDELIFEVDHDAVEEAAKLVKQEMEHAMELSVPLVVAMGSGQNWLAAKEE